MPGSARGLLAIVGLGLALASGIVAPPSRAVAAGGAVAQAPTIYNRSRSFRIPFLVDEADRPRLREVQLYVSEDSGFSWHRQGTTTPDRPAFTFRAERDAEYWFAVRTVDSQGRSFPTDEATVEPHMKVIVDTVPPSLVLEPEGRRGSLASARWEVRDEHLDLASFALEFQVDGDAEWRPVAVRRRALIGREAWDAGTADRLKLRASVADKAGNVQRAEVALRDGVPSSADLAAAEPQGFSAPPPITSISSGPTFPELAEMPRAAEPFSPSTGMAASRSQGPPSGFRDPFESASTSTSTSTSIPAPNPAGSWPSQDSTPSSPPTDPGQPLLVGSPRFALQYAVEDAGPNGPARVELWVTRDGGRNWSPLPEDPDRVSPYPVDLSRLGGDGTYGLSLVARSASGLGDRPPAPGDPPQIWVEVDATPPVVRLGVHVGSGAHAGKVALSWQAADSHLAPQPVVVSYRPDEPGAQWQPITQRIDNTGQFIWDVPPDVPDRFHLRVDVVDTLGNRGSAETTDLGAILVDRARPKGRIIGLDPNARGGPAARPLR